ncbi:hypothetical protein BRADI_1g44865v3 [Brachypodium distachyon]|uniref:Uncharacterized protein n=1 Tax=Brachypodium distachyon TaxID=15368 RepID=A0A2K2DPD5_BRADI|nr:hypothetical protein BRADI_1g44865v3 [Brachypodium distachyon]
MRGGWGSRGLRPRAAGEAGGWRSRRRSSVAHAMATRWGVGGRQDPREGCKRIQRWGETVARAAGSQGGWGGGGGISSGLGRRLRRGWASTRKGGGGTSVHGPMLLVACGPAACRQRLYSRGRRRLVGCTTNLWRCMLSGSFCTRGDGVGRSGRSRARESTGDAWGHLGAGEACNDAGEAL